MDYRDQKKCGEYEPYDKFCKWTRWDMAYKCDFPEFGGPEKVCAMESAFRRRELF